MRIGKNLNKSLFAFAVLSLLLVLVSISFVSSYDTEYWVRDPALCTDFPQDENSISCKSGTRVCGRFGSSDFYCNDTAKLDTDQYDPDGDTLNYGDRSRNMENTSGNPAGYVVNCFADDGLTGDYACDRGQQNYWCQTSSACDSANRKTRCLSGKFAYESNSAECSTECRGNFVACEGMNDPKNLVQGSTQESCIHPSNGPEPNTKYTDGQTCDVSCDDGYASCGGANNPDSVNDNDGCEVNYGTTTSADGPGNYIKPDNEDTAFNKGGAKAVYIGEGCGVQCPDGYEDDDGDLQDGCEINVGAECTTGGAEGTIASDGTCVPGKTNFTTGEKATYLTNGSQEAMLWFQNVNATADLVNITNAIGESWRINNNSCIVLKDDTTICDKGDVGGGTGWNLSGNYIYNNSGEITFNDTFASQNLSVNTSSTWNTSLGELDDINSTQFSNDAGLLGLDMNWLTGAFLEESQESTLDVNSSQYWNTSEGLLGDVSDINGSDITNDQQWINDSEVYWNYSDGNLFPKDSQSNVSIGTNRTYGNRLQVNGSINASGNVTANKFVDSEGNVISGSGNISSNETFNFVTGFTKDKYDGSITNGSLEGYEAANAICNQEYPGSHFCTTGEVLKTNVVNKSISGYAWIANGPPGYTAPANDCEGWTKTDGEIGPYWDYGEGSGVGAGKLATCGSTFRIACCG